MAVTGALGFGSAAAFLSSVTSSVTGQAGAAAGRVADAAREVGSGAARKVGPRTGGSS